MEDIQDRSEQKKRIEKMFRSGDIQLAKLGVLICHRLRINYYIHMLKFVDMTVTPRQWKNILVGYYIEMPDFHNFSIGRIYKIRLEKYKK